ncbi:MAG: hypothetical protein CO003_00630 [Candidatus Portnoybacteria bacterium CG_4_8_14_3_um_filter_44_15]|uniref:Uncharacterized protein n=3 Tax=Candidatus Portnoyibacteriota TaxID=1817913 RepID=A0A2M7YKZ3_9BACT|nr:MAG: hypothetical protein AUJ11_00380 [Parcubacteria group bacterium CG1_02_44_65]PIP15651.1 MAG: hypothetical protein COX45_01635 [Candidatus Portnoybacteria bacterium CG23_combo_of_CG06-09_8_20_14_all_44_36]PIW74819.1 MAG: hypothetical protein CO003_00630 [Candidatus Portnoybacteria bacterium CG_4_8_14_3_um_filter_44_15]PIZ69586.1 MAG: hypothetical protein COY10_01190 [Candidatus Portnoybacteria bacterium CG_4_10_14_0_2_um_filter_43_36]PJA63649.1 MAG: hypothetical protein CO160_02480 [Cand
MNDIKLMPRESDRDKGDSPGFGFSSKNGLSKGVSENISKLGKDITLKGGFLFGLSLMFLIVAILLYLGLWGYKMSLDKQKDGLAQKISELNQTRDVEFENNLMDLKDKIEGLKNILNNQVYSSGIFTLIEDLVVPQVRFASFNGDLAQMTVNLETLAINVDSLVKQMVVFKNDGRVEKATFNSVGTDNSGQINSTIELQLKPSGFYQK